MEYPTISWSRFPTGTASLQSHPGRRPCATLIVASSKKVAGSSLAGPVTGLAPGPKHPLLQWVDAVGGAAGQPLVTPREAAARVIVMEAAYESARSGRWVAA